MRSLVLFDVDATLITTAGLGVRAMVDAGRVLYGPHFTSDGIEFGGGLDPVLIRRLFDLAGVQATPERLAEFRQHYTERLLSLLETAPVKRALPGVTDLLARLGEQESVAVGLLTGNFEHTGIMKLEACGVPTTQFTVRVWGDDSPHDPPDRAHLPPVAMSRFQAIHGLPIDASRVTIIGDTPHDIRAARTCGCRSLGVATGRHSVEQLASSGADRAVPDLSETRAILDWILHA